MTEYKCDLCNQNFRNKRDNYNSHLKTKKHIANVNKITTNNDSTNSVISGNKNQIVVSNDSTIVNTYNLNMTPQQVPITPHCYLYYNIKDLTLYEQYLILHSDNSSDANPFTNLMDFLNFNPDKQEYQNIAYPTYDKNINLFNGKIWKTIKIDIIDELISVQQSLIYSIFNKFRIFLSRRTTIFNIKHLYDGLKISDQHKNFINNMKAHIHYNYNNKTSHNVTPLNSDNPIWKSLSKSFTWDEVTFYIQKMESINIKFSANAYKMNFFIENYLDSHPNEKKDFIKIIDRLSILIYEYNNQKNAYSSSESDEIEKHNISSKRETDNNNQLRIKKEKYREKYPEIAALRERQEIERKSNSKPEIPKSYKRDNHKKMSPKVAYHGTNKIGKKYLSDEEGSGDD